jgi:hypothetical protein
VLAYIYSPENEDEARQAKVLTADEVRRNRFQYRSASGSGANSFGAYLEPVLKVFTSRLRLDQRQAGHERLFGHGRGVRRRYILTLQVDEHMGLIVVPDPNLRPGSTNTLSTFVITRS